MKKLLIIAMGFSVAACATAQPSEKEIDELEVKLNNKSITVNEILADQSWLHLHSRTRFSNLVKKHAPVEKITLVTPAEPGQKINVKCRVVDKEGIPFAGALVYAYQTSAKGWYADTAAHILVNEGDMRHAGIFGNVITGSGGNFELETIQPAGYPKSDLPSHIHIAMWKDEQYVPGVPGELLFDGDKRLTFDRRNRALADGFFNFKKFRNCIRTCLPV